MSWVICAVGDAIEGGETFVKEQPLTDADRRVISLDERERPEFFTLCGAVASLRTYFSLPVAERPPVSADTIANQFSLEEKLGTVGVNDMLHTMLSRSTRPLAKHIVAAATRLEGLARSSKTEATNFLLGEVPPYYQAYLLWHWTGRDDAFVASANVKDLPRIDQHFFQLSSSSFQAWLRRKMVGAMLHIASSLGFRRLPFSGASVVTSLADGSIRDFLEIMASIFDAYKKANSKVESNQLLNRFVTSRTKIAAAVQTTGICASSSQYFEGVGALTGGGLVDEFIDGRRPLVALFSISHCCASISPCFRHDRDRHGFSGPARRWGYEVIVATVLAALAAPTSRRVCVLDANLRGEISVAVDRG